MRLRAACAVAFLHLQNLILSLPDCRKLLVDEEKLTTQDTLMRKCRKSHGISLKVYEERKTVKQHNQCWDQGHLFVFGETISIWISNPENIIRFELCKSEEKIFEFHEKTFKSVQVYGFFKDLSVQFGEFEEGTTKSREVKSEDQCRKDNSLLALLNKLYPNMSEMIERLAISSPLWKQPSMTVKRSLQSKFARHYPKSFAHATYLKLMKRTKQVRQKTGLTKLYKRAINRDIKKCVEDDIANFPFPKIGGETGFPKLMTKSAEIFESHGLVFDEGTSLRAIKKRSDGDDLASIPWQALFLLQSPEEVCGVQVQESIPQLGTTTHTLGLRHIPRQTLGRCPVRFRPYADTHHWLPKNLVVSECVCEGSPCGRLGTHICVTVFSVRNLFSQQTGRRRILLAVGCLCALQQARRAKIIKTQTIV